MRLKSTGYNDLNYFKKKEEEKKKRPASRFTCVVTKRNSRSCKYVLVGLHGGSKERHFAYPLFVLMLCFQSPSDVDSPFHSRKLHLHVLKHDYITNLS